MLASENQAGNPYQPPSSQLLGWDARGDLQAGLLCRDGDKMLIYDGAELPPLCFVTGVPTRTAVDVVLHWQPRWVYGLLLAGILPYFVVSPFVHKNIYLRIPVASAIYQRHNSLVLMGARLLFASLLMFGFAVGLMFLSSASPLILLLALALGFAGALLGSRHAVSLNVIGLDNHVLTIRGVHPKVLDHLPEVTTDACAGYAQLSNGDGRQ